MLEHTNIITLDSMFGINNNCVIIEGMKKYWETGFWKKHHSGSASGLLNGNADAI
jgi:hypothetical protein